jgi:hypothetical protein
MGKGKGKGMGKGMGMGMGMGGRSMGRTSTSQEIQQWKAAVATKLRSLVQV